MDRKIILYLLGAAVLAFIAIMLFPGREADPNPKLPWDVTHDEQGRTRVFTFTLGESTFADVRALFNEEGKVNLFAEPDGSHTVEVYFDQIYLSGLRADFVLTLDISDDTAAAMYNRGLRISQLPSGSKKVKLSPEDVDILLDAPVRTITYLPVAQLEADLLERRFGAPAEKIREANGVTHWLYPERGLDIGRDPDGGIVIQYVNPQVFEAIVAPLREQAAPATGDVPAQAPGDGRAPGA